MSGKHPCLAGLVLAGGQSTRMGRDKARIEWRGKSLLHHAVTALHDAGAGKVFIAGRPDLGNGLADEVPGGGPARAIFSAACCLTAQGWTGLLVLPVDMPGLKGRFLTPLLADREQAAAFEDMPLPLYLPLASIPEAAGLARRVTEIGKTWDARLLPRTADPAALLNINTPEDLMTLDRLHSPGNER